MVPAPSTNPATIVDDAFSISFMIPTVGGSFSGIVSDSGLISTSCSLRRRSFSCSGQTKSLQTSIETPNCLQGRSKSSGAKDGQVFMKSVG